MAPRAKSGRSSEAEVKMMLGDWLAERGLQVFDERRNNERPARRLFQVRNVDRGKRPDLLILGRLSAAKQVNPTAYIAVEVKCGYQHQDILEGFDAVLGYFSDYLWGAEYLVDDRPIEVSAFVFATLFSRQGYLFEQEGKFNPRGIVGGPWDAYPMTFTISRLLWRQKDNLVKRFQSLGAIPKIERKLKGAMAPVRAVPEIGVLVLNPRKEGDILLMLSRNPYNWHLGSVSQGMEGA